LANFAEPGKNFDLDKVDPAVKKTLERVPNRIAKEKNRGTRRLRSRRPPAQWRTVARWLVSIEIGADINVSATAPFAKNGEWVLITWTAIFL
jgi:hypothetical protein